MHPLNLSKVAVGCADIGALADRLAARAAGGETHVVTRYRPTRHAELIGGSLYWIVGHRLVARSGIRGFEMVEGRCRIRLDPDLVPLRHRARRAHQGWRYLVAGDAPPDLGTACDDGDALPAELADALAALALI